MYHHGWEDYIEEMPLSCILADREDCILVGRGHYNVDDPSIVS